ncbi:hypothetical protein [Curtobacterium sp. MCBD17_026]|nr:hypothetical protein [Curtobacterium sp. MCBD17_026]WIB72561.1 hypothetical protein DEI85_17090 [Curtobacterium sp. MCBD17_026]
MAAGEEQVDLENEMAFIDLALRARGLQVDADAMGRVSRML